MKTCPNDPAGALPASQYLNEAVPGYPGLTKREYFAARAMQGLLASARTAPWYWDEVAGHAVRVADELVSKLNKQA